jgi:5-methylcytosine-specific restriction endonuclease McrA
MSVQVRRNRRKAVIRRDGDRCKRCGFFGAEVRLTLDHIIPQAHGGNHSLFNLQLLCKFCNELKADGEEA